MKGFLVVDTRVIEEEGEMCLWRKNDGRKRICRSLLGIRKG